MSLALVDDISLSFGSRRILEHFSLRIDRKDRIGLVGPNGSGKTSLLRLLAGIQQPGSGEIRTSRGARVGYLPQDISELPDGTLRSSVLEAVPGKARFEARVQELERALSLAHDEETQTDLALEMAQLHDRLTCFDALYAPHMADQILFGLGFQTEDMDRPLSQLSGGWRMRAAMAGVLFQQADLLLLDEPTNHLDLPSVRWLAQFLSHFDRAVVLVCHDRDFLNGQINQVISFEPEGVRRYKGNYEAYLTARSEEEKLLERQARNQEQKVKEAMRFIERFRYKATKARQAQSKLKTVKKLEMVATHTRPKTMRFTFPPVAQTGRVVFRLEGVSKSFGTRPVYKDLHLTVERGDRIAVVGPNGAGKTTLLKIMAGELPGDAGTVIVGHNVTASYFAQHHAEQLDQRQTVVNEVYKAAADATVSFVRGVCGAFLFSGDEVDKPVGVLSGGERARVALAKLLVRPGNCLLMDEPTNHLDIVSSERLTEALTGYDGTLVFVSHNQSFINRLATKIWDIKDQGIEQFPGNLREYFEHMERVGPGKAAEPAAQGKAPPIMLKQKERSRGTEKARRRAEAEKRTHLARELKPIRRCIEETEGRICALEKEEGEICAQLKDVKVFEDPEVSRELLKKYGKLRKELDRLMVQWEGENEKMQTIERSFALHEA